MEPIRTKVIGAGSSRKGDDIWRTPDIHLKDDDGELARQMKEAIERGELIFVRKPTTNPNEE